MRHIMIGLACASMLVTPAGAQPTRATSSTTQRWLVEKQAQQQAFLAAAVAQDQLRMWPAQRMLVEAQAALAIEHAAAFQQNRLTRTLAQRAFVEAQAAHAAGVLAPAGWLPQDRADSLWRAAREASQRGDHARAARLYRELRTSPTYARSEYRAASYYWEAYARHRIGTEAELRLAREALAQLGREYPRYEAMADAKSLEATIMGALAQRGDVNAGRALAEAAGQASAHNQQCDDTRMAALQALHHMHSDQALPILKTVMQQRTCVRMREHAVFILSQSSGPEVENILLDAVRNDPSPRVRELAVHFLSQVNSERAVTALEEIVRSSTDAKLIATAVFALSENSSPRSTELLRELVTRPNTPADVRAKAIFALSQRHDASIGPLLRNLFAQTSDQELKNTILFALSQHEGNADFLLDLALNERENIEMRGRALFFASQHGALPLNRLGELYRSTSNAQMRRQVLFALSQSSDPEAIAQLINIARNERDAALKKDAINWIGMSRDPRAVRFLAELIGG